MSVFTNRKNKITLTDYNYRQDIENRLFMAELSILEADVLTEIVNGSLKTPIDVLADNLNISPKELKKVLDKLVKSRLFKIEGTWIVVDKEMRKYYEAQILKFDKDFRPDLEYLQGLLSKVPIQALPLWYAIPRSSDNIFQSIVEKFLQTPKVYERYLQELSFENPILSAIVKEIFEANDYKLSSQKLIEKFKLSREQFEEHMLFLEFSLVGCISYHKVDDVWQEVVTPFHEWREYQLLIQKTNPTPIKDSQNIKTQYTHHFGFLNELNAFLASISKKGIPLKSGCSKIIDACLLLKIARIDKQKVIPTAHTQEWLEKPLPEQALYLYRQSLNHLLSDERGASFSEKDFREVEKSLKRLSHGEWVYFDDFLKGCLAAVGSALPVYLQNKGRRWKYCTPEYRENELQFIKLIICDYLMKAGMIDIGYHHEKLCLCLTPFGRHSLG